MTQQLNAIRQMAQQAAANLTPPDTESNTDDVPADAPVIKTQMQGMSVELHGTTDDSLADVRGEFRNLMEDIQTIGNEAEERLESREDDDSTDSGDAISQLQDEVNAMSESGATGFH